MKIGIDIRHLTSPRHSGVGIYTINLVQELARRAPSDVFLLFASGREQALKHLPKFTFPNVRVETYNKPNKWLSLQLARPGGRCLEDFMSTTPDVWLFPNLNMIKTKLPYALTVHDLSFLSFPEFFTRKQRLWHRSVGLTRLLHDATKIFTVSESTAQDLHNLLHVNRQKMTVTPLGVEPRYHPKEAPSDRNFLHHYGIKKPYFLTLSTLEPRKNIVSVIEAYDAWRKESTHPKPPQLVIAGSKGWKTKNLQQTYNAAWFKADIHFIGYVEERHKPALYRHADALIFPSYYEGFGLPVLEAMACATPVITSFTGSLPELAGDTALYVDPYNVTDLLQAFHHIHACGPFLSEKGRHRSQRFRWEYTANMTLAHLKNLA